MKSLEINVKTKEYTIKEINSYSILSYAINEHLKDKTYNKEPLSEHNPLIISSGPLTGLGIPGAHRVIISGRSPLTKGFFFSTVGGLGEELYRTSVDSIKIKGKAEKPSILIIKYTNNKLIIKIEEVNELNNIYEKNGVFSLQEWLINKYADYFKGLRYRSIVAGPSGFNTNMGGLSSVLVRNNKLDYGSEGFAGRGGFGSVMAQGHNIAGLIIGGDFKKKQKNDIKKKLSELFNEPINKVIASQTIKYRGKGTFLSNFESSENDTLMFNWNSIYWPKEKRLKYYNQLIRNSFLNEFLSKKVISKTCGETCPALCKKVQDVHVKDYEPYSSCGPNLGVFTQKAAESVVNTVDSLGFDAISFGNLISTVFESLTKGLIKTSDLGITELPSFKPDEFKINDSTRNAKLAIKIAKLMCKEKTILNNGIREFSEKNKITLGAFFCFGSQGLMCPNQYLMPGFIAPLPIVGKFTTFYDKKFIEPLELGKRSAERLIKELYNEDTGFCRFHRGWSEKAIPTMINELIKIDYEKHIKSIINLIIKYNQLSDSLPRKWCGKTKELLYQHLLLSVDAFGKSEITDKWINNFKEDPDKALDKYWSELIKGVASVLGSDYKKAMKN